MESVENNQLFDSSPNPDVTVITLDITAINPDATVTLIKVHKSARSDTDTHWFVAAGDTAFFHWRWVIPCKIPCKDPRLLVQCWDLDLLSPNDSLAEANLAFNGLFKSADHDHREQKVSLPAIKLTHPNYNGTQGVIKLDVQVLPEEDARQQPLPAGREGFLADPFPRPPPSAHFGKMLDGFNPYGRMKAYLMYGCAAFCCVLVIAIVGYIAVG